MGDGSQLYWKFLRRGAVSPFTGFEWTVRTWVTADPALTCVTGIHACRRSDLPYWLADELWQVELAGPVTPSRHKVVAGRGRLLGRLEAWDPGLMRHFGEV